MSLGNLKSEGQQGKNYPWQKALVQVLTNLATSLTPSGGLALESTLLLAKTALQSGSFYANNANFVAGDSGAITGTTAVAVIATPGASTSIYITSVLVSNSHVSVGTLVSLVDTGGTTIKGATGYASAAGGGYAITFPTPIKVPANVGVSAICGTTGANVYVSVVGYKGA